MSRKPSVMTSAVRAPVRSRMVLTAMVDPCRNNAVGCRAGRHWPRASGAERSRAAVMETQASSSAGHERLAASFSVRPLSPALGAEIVGVDLGEPITQALAAELLDAWHQSLVIL